MFSQQDGTGFLVQLEARCEVVVSQAMVVHTDAKHMQEAGWTERIQVLRKEKFQRQFALRGVVVVVTGNKQLK